MENLNFIKSNRLVWRQGLPEDVAGSVSGGFEESRLDVMKKDLFRIRRPQDISKAHEGIYTYKKFLSEYKDLLTTDFEAYTECSTTFNSMGMEVYEEFLELGYVYLKSENPDVRRRFVSRVFFTLYYELEREGISSHPLYVNKPELIQKAQKRAKELMKIVAMDKAKDLVTQDPVIFVSVLEYCTNDEVLSDLRKKTGGFDLSDKDLAEVVRRLSMLQGDRIQKIGGVISEIVIKSQERPFENSPLFVKAVGSAAYWVKKSGGKQDVLSVVMRRGNKVMEDAQTREAVEKKLIGNGLQLKDFGF